MSEVTKTFKYSQSGQKLSIGFLIGIIVLTVSFSLYDFSLNKDIDKLRTDITEHKNKVEKLEAQDNVYIYSLIKRHKSVLDEMDERSRITKYMDHLQTIVSHYNVDMRGFQMWWGQISTKATFNNNEKWLAYKKASRFISDYRLDSAALLTLERIPSIRSADQDVKFPVLFTLKK